MKLTGRKRLRVQNRLFRQPLVVLQLEYEVCDPGPVDIDPGYTVHAWIDAKPEDIENGLEGFTTD